MTVSFSLRSPFSHLFTHSMFMSTDMSSDSDDTSSDDEAQQELARLQQELKDQRKLLARMSFLVHGDICAFSLFFMMIYM